jgi:hypothetical protein
MTVRTEEPATQTRPSRRGPWLLTGAVLAALVLAGAVLGVTMASTPTTSTAGSGQGAVAAPADATTALVGKWALVATIHTQEPPSPAWLDCDFGADHHVTCVNPPGRPTLGGEGVWNATGGDGFSFWLTHHAQLDKNGKPTGSIYAEHVGKLTRNAFTTQGITFIDLHNGTPWIGPVVVTLASTRIS